MILEVTSSKFHFCQKSKILIPISTVTWIQVELILCKKFWPHWFVTYCNKRLYWLYGMERAIFMMSVGFQVQKTSHVTLLLTFRPVWPTMVNFSPETMINRNFVKYHVKILLEVFWITSFAEWWLFRVKPWFWSNILSPSIGTKLYQLQHVILNFFMIVQKARNSSAKAKYTDIKLRSLFVGG